ncbi:MAG: dUTP diphosphatase [Elusimicrobia bacterium]|nr:dUTP diphosphatase [Elusimicrobiota bacterium]
MERRHPPENKKTRRQNRPRPYDAKLPHRAHATDSGADLFSVEDALLPPHTPVKIRTGISVALPEGTSGLLWGKSSLESEGLKVVAGLVDAPYRGEIIVCMVNLTDEEKKLPKGRKIAQLVVIPTYYPQFLESAELAATERGQGGFGSSGQN